MGQEPVCEGWSLMFLLLLGSALGRICLLLGVLYRSAMYIHVTFFQERDRCVFLGHNVSMEQNI